MVVPVLAPAFAWDHLLAPGCPLHDKLTMTNCRDAALLVAPPVGRHLCQLHRHVVTLSESVALYAGTGLQLGEAAVIFATPEHVEVFLADLERMGVDVVGCRRSGQLTLVDAHATLARCMVNGMPDRQRFQSMAAATLERHGSRHGAAIRVYGELVNLLWHDGQPLAAIRLEELWNGLLRQHAFTLLCGYLLDGLDARSYDCPLQEIGRTHSDVLPTDDDERLRVAVDSASEEVLGAPLSRTISCSGREQTIGEHRLPIGRRTLLWLQRNTPGSVPRILERARHHFGLMQPAAHPPETPLNDARGDAAPH
jgi:hypothetical protein